MFFQQKEKLTRSKITPLNGIPKVIHKYAMDSSRAKKGLLLSSKRRCLKTSQFSGANVIYPIEWILCAKIHTAVACYSRLMPFTGVETHFKDLYTPRDNNTVASECPYILLDICVRFISMIGRNIARCVICEFNLDICSVSIHRASWAFFSEIYWSWKRGVVGATQALSCYSFSNSVHLHQQLLLYRIESEFQLEFSLPCLLGFEPRLL